MDKQPGSDLPVPVARPAPPVAGDAGSAGGLPFGLGSGAGVSAVLRALWSLRADPVYAARLLTQSVGDGCGLGSWGMDHPVLPGRHLCPNRVARVRQELSDGLVLADVLNVEALRTRSPAALRALGRLPFPMVRRRGDRGFSRASWDEALALAAAALQSAPGERQGWLAGRDRLTNEAAYALSLTIERTGSPNLDCVGGGTLTATRASLCPALGVSSATGTFADVLNADLVLLCGVDPARNHPSLLRLLHHAKAEGARVVSVNPAREPGLDRAWVTDEAGLAIWGTRLTDDFVGLRPGGDAPLFSALLLLLARWGAVDQGFIDDRAEGWSEWLAALESVGLDEWLSRAGVSAQEAEWLARLVSRADKLVTIYSGGLTDPAWGAEAVGAVSNLHIARGALSRPGCAILPLMERLSTEGDADFGVFPRPGGMDAAAQVEAAAGGALDFWYLSGVNPLAELPNTPRVQAALEGARARVHQGWWLDPSMLVDPGELTVVLPARLRHEQPGGTTSTSSDRVVRRSPYIPGGYSLPETCDDWAIPLRLLHAAGGEEPSIGGAEPASDVAALRHGMADANPRYARLTRLDEGAAWFRLGGQHLALSERLTFIPADVKPPSAPEGALLMSPRRPVEGAPDAPCALLMSAEDARAHRLSEGALVIVSGDVGEAEAVLRIVTIRPGTTQLERPAANAVSSDASCGAVTVRRAD